MAWTLRQLWADEEDAHERQPHDFAGAPRYAPDLCQRDWATVERIPAYAPSSTRSNLCWANLKSLKLATCRRHTGRGRRCDRTGLQRVCMHEDPVVGFLAPPACPSTHETSTNPRKLNELRTLSVHNDRRDHRLTQRLSVSCRHRRGRRRRAAVLPKALLPITGTTVAILRTRSDAGHW